LLDVLDGLNGLVMFLLGKKRLGDGWLDVLDGLDVFLLGKKRLGDGWLDGWLDVFDLGLDG
jgi:hypothetical protein